MMRKYILGFLLLVILSACSSNNEVAVDERCSLIPSAGPCKAAIPRYYFDSDLGACSEFTWGGCEGVVPFKTLEECRFACEQ